jgi:hypothetical protein
MFVPRHVASGRPLCYVPAVIPLHINPENREILMRHAPEGSAAWAALESAKAISHVLSPGAHVYIAECGMATARILLDLAEQHCPTARGNIEFAIRRAELAAKPKPRRGGRRHDLSYLLDHGVPPDPGIWNGREWVPRKK